MKGAIAAAILAGHTHHLDTNQTFSLMLVGDEEAVAPVVELLGLGPDRGLAEMVMDVERELNGRFDRAHLLSYRDGRCPVGGRSGGVRACGTKLGETGKITADWTILPSGAVSDAHIVGAHAGELILAGATRRGSGTTVRAAILICDLRDFTGMSEHLDAEGIIRFMNDYLTPMTDAMTVTTMAWVTTPPKSVRERAPIALSIP